ncbi:hypothetical protein BDF20DRAFT_839852 [Mycotypha africana]|uniref:uncharacterized protein n=1 Tax=Mycotypha africana TaxID=64632 RepID=UPI0023011D70|nr:uncharacterized protein BDF20DRAFT_839852 [Mycotypha africana]KAI8968027.1 hypothetical protein BDF20DRAFT_839852 [Mycotypha africana]
MTNRARRYHQSSSLSQYPRRYSYPPTRNVVPAAFFPGHSKKPFVDNIVYPLTEENLAIHTSCMAPQSQEEKLRNLILFVQNQHNTLLEQQQQQQQQREPGDDSIRFVRTDSVASFRDDGEQLQHYCGNKNSKEIKKTNWLKKFAKWLRTSDQQQQQERKPEVKNKNKSRRHLSWSAGINLKKAHTVDLLPDQQQHNAFKKRDSGFSSRFFFHSISNENCNKRTNQQQQQLNSIPIIRQPKFSSYNDENTNHAFPVNNPSSTRRKSYHMTRNPASNAALLFEETGNSRVQPYVAV